MKRLEVIPTGWSEHHRPTAYGFLTGRCRANGPDEEVPWSEDTPSGIIPGKLIWDDVPFSAQILTQFGRDATVVDTSEVTTTYRVSVPIEYVAAYGDTITVLSNPDDEELNGVRMQVLSTQMGTTNWTRELDCEVPKRGG